MRMAASILCIIISYYFLIGIERMNRQPSV
jgi:hypothetical protein